MAYNFNGHEVGLILNVGNNLHNVCTQFTGYNEITDQEYIRLPEQDRKNRVEAFYAYLSGTYNTDIRQLVKLNPEFLDIRSNNSTCVPLEKPYKVSVTIENGHVNGVDSFVLEFAKGERCTVRSISNSRNDYEFGAWYINDVMQNGIGEEISFIVESDVRLAGKYLPYYTVAVVSGDTSKGTVSGGGRVLAGGKVSIAAAAIPGTYYSFIGWREQETGNSLSLSGNAEYEPTRDIVLVAHFDDTRPTAEVSVRFEYDFENEILSIWAHRSMPGPEMVEVHCQEKWGAIFVEALTIGSNEKDSEVLERSYPSPWESYFVINSIVPIGEPSYIYYISSDNLY